MRVKRYQASTLEEALHLVRSDLGRDAIILETHRVRLPGLKGLFAPHILEVSAVGDNAEVHVPWDAPEQEKESAAPARLRALVQREPAAQPVVMLAKTSPGEVADVVSLSAQAAAIAAASNAGEAETFTAGLPVAQAFSSAAYADSSSTRGRGAPDIAVRPMPGSQDLVAQVEELHAMLAQVQAALRDLSAAQNQIVERARPEQPPVLAPQPTYTPADPVASLAMSLGFSAAVARVLAEIASDTAGAAPMEDPREALHKALSHTVRVCGAMAPSDRPVVLLLIGGTGQGKTSAAARIAASLAPAGSVALATIGTSGLGSPSQLLTLCLKEGVTFRACRGLPGLAAFLAAEGHGVQYIVVDTPGGNLESAETQELLAGVRSLDAEVRVLLVASASTQPVVLERAITALPDGAVMGLVVTKLDETSSLPALVDLSLRRSLAFAYVSAAPGLGGGLLPATAPMLASWATGQTSLAQVAGKRPSDAVRSGG